MNDITLSLEEEIHVAEIGRSLELVAQVWESDVALTVDEMCEHLEAVNDIVIKASSFTDFVETTNFSGLERLN